MTQPGVHTEPGYRKSNHNRYQNQQEKSFDQLIEKIPAGSSQDFTYTHLFRTGRTGKHHQYPKPHTGNENRQYGKEGIYNRLYENGLT